MQTRQWLSHNEGTKIYVYVIFNGQKLHVDKTKFQN